MQHAARFGKRGGERGVIKVFHGLDQRRRIERPVRQRERCDGSEVERRGRSALARRLQHARRAVDPRRGHASTDELGNQRPRPTTNVDDRSRLGRVDEAGRDVSRMFLGEELARIASAR